MPFALFQDAVMLLQDGNKTLYPLTKNATGGIRDPVWLDLPPARCLDLGTHYLNHISLGSNLKNKVAVIVMALEVCTYSPPVHT